MNDTPRRPTAPPHKATDTHSQAVEGTAGPGAPASGTNPTVGAPRAAPDTEALPQLGDYRVVRKIGEGGMGSVYLAEDTKLGRKAALKTMKAALAADRANRDRFEREARAAAAVEHDNIVPILHIGEASDGTPFIAMPFLHGEMLDSRLKRDAVPSPDLLVKVAYEVAEGLAAAHAAGLIHRDIKPGNIWLEGDPTAPDLKRQVRRCKILDFGLARSVDTDDAHITASGAILGTPAYMPPEQARGERVDHRADLWSLGVTLYRMATGRMPFRGPNAMAVLIALTTETPPTVRELAPHLPPALADLIDRLMSKDANARPQSAAEVSATVRRVVQNAAAPTSSHSLPVAAPAPNPWEEATETDPDDADGQPIARAPLVREGADRTRLPWLIGAAAAGLLALAVLAAAIIRFETAEGTLVVEVNDPDAELKFKDSKLILFGPDGKERYRLSPAARDKKIAPGPYTVRVEGSDGLLLDTPAFTLKKGDKVTVRVTIAPTMKPIEPKKKDDAKPAGALDFREIHGATEAELEKWVKGLQSDGYIPSYIGTEASAALRFSATAVPNPSKTTWQFHPRQEVNGPRWMPDFQARMDAGFRPAMYGVYHDTGRQYEAQVWLTDGLAGGAWSGDRAFMTDKLQEVRKSTYRPTAVAASLSGKRTQYQLLLRPSDGRDWDAQLDVPLEDLPGEVAKQRKKGWRLEWLSAYRDGDRPRFLALFVENPDRSAWDFHMGMTAKECEERFAARTARPLSVVGYTDGDQTRYAVVWSRDEPRAGAGAWVPLFNGKDLTGWGRSDGTAGRWRVTDGVITCSPGVASYLISDRSDFDDFHLRAEVRINDKGNSGIYFRASNPLVPLGDYEAQICTRPDQQRTGSLYNLVRVNENPVAADTWFTMEVVAQGNRIRVLVNGKETADYTETRANRRSAGHVALQHHDAQTSVQFRKIEVREFKAAADLGPDRKGAEYVASIGGAVRIDDGPHDAPAATWPTRPFRLTAVMLHGNQQLTPAGLAVLRDCRNISIAWLNNSRVTNDGLAHFKSSTEMTELHLHGTGVTDAGLAHFNGHRSLRHVNLGLSRTTGVGLANFKGCSDLRILQVYSLPLTDNDLAVCAGFPHLTELWAENARTTDALPDALKNCPNLKALDVSGTALTDVGLERLKAFTKLTNVHVRRTKVTAAKIDELAKALPRCRIEWDGGIVASGMEVDRAAAEWVLSVGGAAGVDGVAKEVRAAADLPKHPFRLTRVQLAGRANLAAADLRRLRDCPDLAALDLSRTAVTDADLAGLAGCTNLTQLHLSSTAVTDAGLAHFAQCRNLTHVELAGTRIKGPGLEHLQSATDLRHLRLAATDITGAALEPCKEWKALEFLDVGGTAVGDVGLEHLKGCTQLRAIHAGGTRVTDAGLDHLKGLALLTGLDLRDTKVTASRVTDLAKALPRCRIAWDGGIEPGTK